ncbi:tRNA (adenosine(37)-N6)-dimethylallyltransferase MiaA [Alsobacter sp. SYSU M60028]|uniref:tRNA dimethylallyltransferase n=1 Tax=Alsobacter ponti TaxID=2962936 RepID=A0ABT1L6Z1_9HYPH|nr:tRNA (adenosine(37)-N6)-dimethylallyltransferase MiaA [Alsobacter ponti]
MAHPFRAILIAGPTASGKSALAIRLAQELGGAVVNADSMQVYRDLRIITARPTEEEEAQAPHRLFGYADAAENLSVARWLEAARAAVAEVEGRGLLPIVTGGTGLYFRALTEGLSNIPPVPADLRERLRALAETLPAEELHARLAERDPATAATLKPADRQRTLRALEVFEASGRPLLSFHGEREGAVLEADSCLRAFLAPDRDDLYARIDRRFDAMISLGALEEVRRLAQRELSPALPAMRAHGVPWLTRALRDEMTLGEAIERAKLDTRHYAKRQFTWFRHQGQGWDWLAPDAAEAEILRRLGRV